MKERELRELARCCVCKKLLGECGPLNIFFKVTFQNFVADRAAIDRQHGLGLMLGGMSTLAMAMGPDEDLAKAIGEPQTKMVCHGCSMKDELSSVLYA